MRLAIFNDYRLGAVHGDEIVDVTAALPWEFDPDPLTAGWWRRLCRDFDQVSHDLRQAAERGTPVGLSEVRLRAPVLNPSKIVACASNYAEHVSEMHGVQQRTLGGVESWMMDFDIFLKAPSSIIGPSEDIVLPPAVVEAGHEIHHESELVIVIGVGGTDIPADDAMSHVRGYTIGLDITVRSPADRSRRKSHDTFSPLGPWFTTVDDLPDPGNLDIRLECNGVVRQSVNTRTLITSIGQIVAYASRMMTLLPGDIIFTGAPPGVGPIVAGDTLDTSIEGLGSMRHLVR
jgi:2-keto-4-pentenoate hydratase/2-oxohepta-3-ene-1,7-dioic acid hydratase in catechol pathway